MKLMSLEDNWIPVKYELPKTGVDILVSGRLSIRHRKKVVRSGEREIVSDEGEWEWNIDGDEFNNFIVEAWMYAPKPF